MVIIRIMNIQLKLISMAVKTRWRAWLIWGIASFFYLYEYIQRVIPGTVVDELMNSFSANATDISNMAAFYFYSYALLQLPVGVLADYFGPKRPLFWACFLCVAGCFAFSQSDTLMAAKASRFLIGAGSAFAYLCCLRLSVNWFPVERFSLVCGLVGVVGMLGAFASVTTLTLLLKTIDWRTLLVWISIIGLINAALIWFFVKDFPGKIMPKPKRHSSSLSVASILTALRTPQIWLSGLYCGMVYTIFDAVGDLWGINYLTTTYKLSKMHAAEINSLIFLGGMVGSVLLGKVAQHYHQRKPLLLLTALLGLLTSSLLVLNHHLPIWSVIAVFFLLGCVGSGFVISMTLAKESLPLLMSGVTMGCVNTLSVCIESSTQPLLGFLLDWHHAPSSTSTHMVYNAASYNFAFTLLPCLCLLGMLVTLLMRESRGQQCS